MLPAIAVPQPSSPPSVRKAVIPAAGFGTRLFPATKAVKKELFPIIDAEGRAKPVILAIVEEALSAGIESVGIVVQPCDRELFETFFNAPPEGDYFQKLVAKQGAYLEYLQEVGDRITILTQEQQEGFGHAVFCAKDWVQDEPFLLLLGDHVYKSDLEVSCAAQMLAMFERCRKSVISLEVTPAAEISHRGCVTGTWQEPQVLLDVTQLVEKPEVEYARQHLHIPGMDPDQLLSIFGMYVLPPQIFDYLEEQIRGNLRDRNEFQLTSGLERLRQELGMMGYMVQGRSFDTGLPDAYRQALIEFRQT
ncbi:UTP--glucose-1-phosphate uridylyltransferase [Trichocoleus sp. FACHB-591]|uniref:UTP--glucose-1-phosphate uridylyltransferase n=1 Tax=Trichocoleus sp. FACHB-591 TaxID=2692872 RepID=UPI00168759D6|nr:UTP--glucose-1-phosphate uridylyltransferase [Trichocoleus sp. FACHB-591]MBD2096184.1 UTP--glucose-1-phosphate uridylyltransferase [Trichocoleus sp. FACHB-591]